MKWLILFTGLAAGATANAAKAEDAKPVMEPPGADITGTWRMIAVPVGGFATGIDDHGQRPESCTFQQAGNNLRGTCRTTFGEGPISGTISGQTVEWRWLYKVGQVRPIHAFDVAVFSATLLPDGRVSGGFRTYPAFDRFDPSFEYADTHKFVRPVKFTATKQPADRS